VPKFEPDAVIGQKRTFFKGLKISICPISIEILKPKKMKEISMEESI